MWNLTGLGGTVESVGRKKMGGVLIDGSTTHINSSCCSSNGSSWWL